MTTRTRWTIAAILNVVVIAILWTCTGRIVVAKQDQPPRLHGTEVTSDAGSAQFIQDRKSGGCWLALRRLGTTLLAPAPPASCEEER